MGRPRRKKIVSRSVASKRDKYGRDRSAEYARRNAKARSWGFRSYWDQRSKGDWASLLKFIQPNDVVMLNRHVKDHQRNTKDEWEVIEKVVHPDDPRRREKRFTLRNLSDKQLAKLIELELDRGANMTLIPSLDQQRLLRDSRAA